MLDQDQQHPEETPALLKASLEEFRRAVDQLEDCPALRLAQNKCPKLAKDNETFQLMFLRTEVYHADRAAARYAKYWQDRVSLWQDHAFDEDLALLPNDVEAAASGFLLRAKGHERLLYMAVGRLPKAKQKVDVDSMCRVCLHTMMQALQESEALQKQGALVVLDFHRCTGYDRAFYERFGQVTSNSFPLRISCVGLVRPLPCMGLIVDIIKLFVKPKLRKRIHVIRNDEKLAKHTDVDSVEGLLKLVQK